MLEELKKEGRIRYYGFSNYRTERLKEIAQCLRERNLSGITAVSNQWSLAGINPGGMVFLADVPAENDFIIGFTLFYPT